MCVEVADPLEVVLYVLLVCRGGAEAHATQSALTGPTLVQLLQEADVQVTAHRQEQTDT